MPGPKLFISYSWTTPDHEMWVLNLATELRESGIEVILDKWDLREGHDAHAFMEKMVTDPEIKKVVMVCDKAYADKTDGRSGGVGTEAQIISGEIYAKQAQDKFVAIVTERDENGRAYLPAYYRSRIYIDLSDSSRYPENFERLVRWAFDQPLYKKPELGKKPAFLSEESEAVSLATSSRLKRALSEVRNRPETAQPALEEYLSCLAEELAKFRIDPAASPFDEAVIKSIEAFLPYRNEAIEVFQTLAAYLDTEPTRVTLHRFFERLIPYLDRPQHVSTWRESDFDNFRFIVHELFLYAVASFVRDERFESAAHLMSSDYYLPTQAQHGRDVMVDFTVFWKPTQAIEQRNQRLSLRRLSVRSDLLEQRCAGIGLEFRHLMQADFVLFVRGCVEGRGWRWWPATLLFAGRQPGPFEIFARSRSAGYFDRVKVLFGIQSKEELRPLLEFSAVHGAPTWQYESFGPIHLIGFEQIASKA
jgi:hypothetical protein